MSENRLIALSNARRQKPVFLVENYPSEVCTLIEKYINYRISIEKANPVTSWGISRARALLQHIKEDLIKQRNFTAQQLMWIMYEYAARDHGAWPLETSSVLREHIVHHLCKCLGISEEQIDRYVESYYAGRLNLDSLAVTRPGLFNPKKISEPYEFVTEVLIKRGLVGVSGLAATDNQPDYSKELLATLDEYIKWAEKKWFKGDGIIRANKIKELVTKDWLQFEKLDETQMMWRIVEQLSLPRENHYGIFCTSTDCRLMVMRNLCKHLGVASVVKEKTKKEVNLHFVQRVGFYYLDATEDDTEKELRIGVDEIKRALLARNQLTQQPHRMSL